MQTDIVQRGGALGRTVQGQQISTRPADQNKGGHLLQCLQGGLIVWGAAHLGLSIQSSGFLSSGSSISSAGLMDGSKSSRMLPDFFTSPSMSSSYLQMAHSGQNERGQEISSAQQCAPVSRHPHV